MIEYIVSSYTYYNQELCTESSDIFVYSFIVLEAANLLNLATATAAAINAHTNTIPQNPIDNYDIYKHMLAC